MRIIVRQSPPEGGARRVVVDRERLDAFRTPPWWTRPGRFVVSWLGLAAALCLHAFGVAALALWQEPSYVDASEVYSVTVLTDIPPVEVCPLPADTGDDGNPELARAECAASMQAESAPSNYWDLVRAAIADSVRYPPSAVRQGIEGTIDLRLTLDARGALVEVVPLERTPELLIQSAVSAARRAAPFPPNTNGIGDVVSAILPVHFQLNRNPGRSSMR